MNDEYELKKKKKKKNPRCAQSGPRYNSKRIICVKSPQSSMRDSMTGRAKKKQQNRSILYHSCCSKRRHTNRHKDKFMKNRILNQHCLSQMHAHEHYMGLCRIVQNDAKRGCVVSRPKYVLIGSNP